MKPPAYPCPICEVEMSVKPYQRAIGFKYECRGTAENPHTVQLYVRTSFPEASVAAIDREGEEQRVVASQICERTESLLERVKRLSGKGE